MLTCPGAIGAYGYGADLSAGALERNMDGVFLEGIALDDPGGRLEGAGNMVRSIRLDDRAAILDDPYSRGLMTQALKVADADLKSGRGQVVLKSKVAARRV